MSIMDGALLILFIGLGLAGLSVYLFVSALMHRNVDAEALAWASGDEPNKSKSELINFSRPLVHNFTLQHALRIKSPAYRERVRKKILTAGLDGELNVDEFIGLQILWGIFFPIILVILNFTLQLELPYVACLAIGLLGVQVPHLHCANEKSKRYVSVVADLPFFIDLMALSTQAGLDFISSIQRIVEKAQNSVLADEFGRVLKEIRLGSSRKDALINMAERLDVPELTSFVTVVRDADETGTSIAAVLKDQSIQLRLERFVRAEKAGAKASQLMLLPMMFFIMPAVLVLVFGPVILQFWYGGG